MTSAFLPTARQLALLLVILSSLSEVATSGYVGRLAAGEPGSLLQALPDDRKWDAVIMPTIAASATVIGALALLFVRDGEPSPWIMAFMLSLAAGLMVAVSYHMLTSSRGGEALSYVDVLVFLSGALVCGLLCHLFRSFVSATGEHDPQDGAEEGLPQDVDEASYGNAPRSRGPMSEDGKKAQSTQPPSHLGSIMLATICAHNIPEGAAVAIAASLTEPTLGIALMLAVALHNIPEGAAVSMALYRETLDRWESFYKTVFCGLMELLGAFLALMFLEANQGTPAGLILTLTAVAGVMCYVAIGEILPEVVQMGEWLAIGSGLGLGFGCYLGTMAVIKQYLDDGRTAAHLQGPGDGRHWFI